MNRTDFRTRQQVRKLMLHVASNVPVKLCAVESGGDIVIAIGIIHRVEREDGSGLRWNVTLVRNSGAQTTLFFDCENPRHDVCRFQYNRNN